jgi:BirA family biotin operon repressor/biotin-[acetyl-CoA-carboxylase] ligase
MGVAGMRKKAAQGVIGATRVVLDSVDSTNKYAADRLSLPELPHGSVILAHEQTEGRGQRGRTWSSAKGLDLTFSIVLRPSHLKASDQFVLAKVAALAVQEVVEEVLRVAAGLGGGPVCVKWPNDVLVGHRKVAGILIQNELVGERVAAAIIGIGLNVNSTELQAGPDATSLRLEAGLPQDRMGLLDRLCERFQHWWELCSADRALLDARYADLLWGRGRFVDLERDGRSYTGRPLDVDEAGRLLVEDPDGRVQAYGLDRLRFGPRS